MVLPFSPEATCLVGASPHVGRSQVSLISVFSRKASVLYPVISLGLSLGWNPMAVQAQSDVGVRSTSGPGVTVQLPPEGGLPDTNNRGGGSRGCSRLLGEAGMLEWSADSAFASPSPVLIKGGQEQPMPAVLLLTDAKGQIQTRSPRPRFAWYIRDHAPVPLEFRIYRQPTAEEIAAGQFAPEDAEMIWETSGQDFVSRPGLMVLTLPNAAPALEPGQHYWWQIEMRCDPKDPSSNAFAEAVVEIVPESARSLWYDQFDQLLKLETESEKADPLQGHLLGKQVSEEMAELLQAEMGMSPQTAKALKNSQFYPISLDAESE